MSSLGCSCHRTYTSFIVVAHMPDRAVRRDPRASSWTSRHTMIYYFGPEVIACMRVCVYVYMGVCVYVCIRCMRCVCVVPDIHTYSHSERHAAAVLI